MKTRLAFLLAIASAASFFVFRQAAQSEKFDSGQNPSRLLSQITPQNVRAVAAGVSPKVGSLKDLSRPPVDSATTESEVRFTSENQILRRTAENVLADADRNLAGISSAPMPAPSLSFEGMTNRMNGEIFGFYYLPSDTMVDVGPNHVVQTVNTLVRVYDKNGAALTPPFRMSDIFGSLGTATPFRLSGR
jgi:hypothetical protein